MARPSSILVPVFAAGAVGWLGLVIAAPWLPATVAAAVYAIGSLACHQIPDRSFHWGTVQLPVCARCTGIYAGSVVTLAGLWRGPGWQKQLWSRPAWVRACLVAGAAPTAITVVAEWSGWWLPGNAARAVAGVPLGLSAALVVLAALSTLHYGECLPPRAAGPPRRTPM